MEDNHDFVIFMGERDKRYFGECGRSPLQGFCSGTGGRLAREADRRLLFFFFSGEESGSFERFLVGAADRPGDGEHGDRPVLW